MGAFYLLLITQPDWLCPVVSSWRIAAQAPAARFLLLPPIFRERDASSRREKTKPFGRTLRGPALPRRLCLRRYHRRRRREGWRFRLRLKGYAHILAHTANPKGNTFLDPFSGTDPINRITRIKLGIQKGFIRLERTSLHECP